MCIDDYSRFIISAEQFEHELEKLKLQRFKKSNRSFRRLFCPIMDRSSKSNGRNGAVSMALRLNLLTLPIPKIKARLNGASKTSIENSLIHYASSLNGSKAR